MKTAKALLRQIEIENGIIKRINRGESVRVGSQTIDDQTVADTMYNMDPDRYVKAVRTIASGSMSEAEAAIETVRRLWDYATAAVLQEHAEAITKQAQREAQHDT